MISVFYSNRISAIIYLTDNLYGWTRFERSSFDNTVLISKVSNACTSAPRKFMPCNDNKFSQYVRSSFHKPNLNYLAATTSISTSQSFLTKPDTSTSVLAGLLSANNSFRIADTTFELFMSLMKI